MSKKRVPEILKFTVEAVDAPGNKQNYHKFEN